MIKNDYISLLLNLKIDINYDVPIKISDSTIIRRFFIDMDNANILAGGDEFNGTNSGKLKFYIDDLLNLTIYENDINSIFICQIDYIEIYINGKNTNCDPEIFIYSKKKPNAPLIQNGLRLSDGTDTFDKQFINEYMESIEAYNNYATNEKPEKLRYVTVCNAEGLSFYVNILLIDIKPLERIRMPNEELFRKKKISL